MGVTISGMTGAGSIRHNNRSFSAANVDRQNRKNSLSRNNQYNFENVDKNRCNC